MILEQSIFNVTFEPGCCNNCHIHNAEEGSNQWLEKVADEEYSKATFRSAE
ncbi:MAG: hypothetical protein MJ184_10740 [Treponema sp.]|uniref:hypothetical protein n=1 Tax=Treponema sp. TaxID=166 RepID=UPI00298DF323|nr:hypothetical protein [Treponema sp.]MCQ2601824.1 hypothetical protein [Treponema sp.]